MSWRRKVKTGDSASFLSNRKQFGLDSKSRATFFLIFQGKAAGVYEPGQTSLFKLYPSEAFWRPIAQSAVRVDFIVVGEQDRQHLQSLERRGSQRTVSLAATPCDCAGADPNSSCAQSLIFLNGYGNARLITP